MRDVGAGHQELDEPPPSEEPPPKLESDDDEDDDGELESKVLPAE